MKWIQIGDDAFVIPEKVTGIVVYSGNDFPTVLVEGGESVYAGHFQVGIEGPTEALKRLIQRLNSVPEKRSKL